MFDKKCFKSLRVFCEREDIVVEGNEELIRRSDCLLFQNGGLMCHVSREQLERAFGPTLREILLIPLKSYSLLRFSSEEEVISLMEQKNRKFCPILDRKLSLCPLSRRIWDQISDKYSKTIEEYEDLFKSVPEGLVLEEEFLSAKEEEEILSFIQRENFFAEELKNRSVKHFGFEFDYKLNKVGDKAVEPIPEEFQFILRRLINKNACEELPDQLTINRYLPGQGIPGHVDSVDTCSSFIISLSLGSDSVMIFRRHSEQKNILLKRRSLVVMSGQSRYQWSHGITASKSDVIWDSFSGFSLNFRKTRVSLTFRKKVGGTSKEGGSERLEAEFVHKVYDAIAEKFSSTRFKKWPKVEEFLEELPVGSLVLDIGCGNGKYLKVKEKELFVFGSDRSENLLNICRNRKSEVFLSDCTRLPVRSNSFDAVISIAVIHHLSSRERRIKALEEISRVLNGNGSALIYVWAFEQSFKGTGSQYLKPARDQQEHEELVLEGLPVHVNGTQFRSQELLVPFRTGSEERLRFYHVFRENELLDLFSHVKDCHVTQVYYDSGNWAARVKKARVY